MALNVFLDTEFTDFIDPHLISMGMAADSGQQFYAEVPYPDQECSAFVREAVIPLLGRIPDAACAANDLPARIICWLESIRPRNEDLVICVDYQTDWDLLADVLDCRIPPWCHRRMVAPHINQLVRYEFHKKHRLPEHHALYDALANRYAFREAPEATSGLSPA